MKFLHTSDWHLGRQFHNVSLLGDQKVVLTQLIEYMQLNPVDALVIAGDIYDRSVPPTAAIELMDWVINQVCHELNIPIILIPGNHDGAQRLGFASDQMKQAGLHIIADFDTMLNPVTISSNGLDVAFYGMPYNDPELVRHYYQESVKTHDDAHKRLSEKIREQFQPHHKNILISHCFVDGAMESDSERPLSIGGSDRVSHEHFSAFDYVALGHLHQPQKKGEDYIRYSGSLMKYSFSEQHQKKGVTLVEIDSDGFKSSTHIDIAAPHQMRIIEGNLDAIVNQGKTDPYSHDYIMVRLMDQHAILNPMEKLRTAYPNVLHIEKPGMQIGVERELTTAALTRNEVDMFKDFFMDAQGNELSEQQTDAIQDIVKRLREQED